MPQIKDYADWPLSAARADCEAMQLRLIVDPDCGDNVDAEPDQRAVVEGNSPGSTPGTWIDVGGQVGVILYRREPRQRQSGTSSP